MLYYRKEFLITGNLCARFPTFPSWGLFGMDGWSASQPASKSSTTPKKKTPSATRVLKKIQQIRPKSNIQNLTSRAADLPIITRWRDPPASPPLALHPPETLMRLNMPQFLSVSNPPPPPNSNGLERGIGHLKGTN